MHIPVAAAISGAMLLAACQPSFDPEDPTAIAAIDSIVRRAMEGAAHVDADQVLAMAAEDVTFITSDVMLSGLETLRALFKETYGGLERQDQILLESRIRLVSRDVAIVTVIADGTYTDKAGWTSEPVGIGTTLVFVRENDEWQVRHAHQSIAF